MIWILGAKIKPQKQEKKDAAKEVRNKHDYRSFDCNTV